VAPLEPYERLFVDSDFLEEDVHGKMLSCEKCHGGNPKDNNWKTAHKGVIKDPSYPDPSEACGVCHREISKRNSTSLHIRLLPYKNKMHIRVGSDKEVRDKVKKAMDTHCMGCHSSCGQCHVSRPNSVGGGLVEGHFFKKTPPVETNCTSCHGSRMEKEYFGKNKGVPADVHHTKGRFKCTDCHRGDEMHGSGKEHFDRYEVTNRARCEDCHQEVTPGKPLSDKSKPLKHPAHAIHKDKVSCQTCHSVSYKHCYNCHVGKDKHGDPYFKTEPSVMGFKIGFNPKPTKERPERYVTVRHIPISRGLFDFYVKDALTNFDKAPTWKMATPHTIQLKTPQNKDCVTCHTSNDFYLTEKDVRPEEIKANTDIIPLPQPELAIIHKWLPNVDLHLSRVDCIFCHEAGGQEIRRYVKQGKTSHLSCAMCHSDIAKEYEKSCHYRKQNFACQVCHSEKDIHAEKPDDKTFKQAVLEKCTECHAKLEYVNSGHGKAVLAGNKDAATCSDCHGLHSTKAYETCAEKDPIETKLFYNTTCKKCHADKEMMERNNLSPNMVKYYENTYHGKVQSVGYPSMVAGCVDCHSNHNILPKENIFSTINSNNLLSNCGKCHRGFHLRFVQFKAHPDYTDREKYPALYWTFMFMSGLLLTVFLFFGMHTFLWWRKVYWEKHLLEKMEIVPKRILPDSEGAQDIQRFSVKESIMHIILIISFFTLVLTGFPLRFNNAKWAEPLVSLFGGAHIAGLFHRTAALILITLFLYVLWRCFKFLFPKGVGTKRWYSGWSKRLFGPDSLFFNLKDWEDFKGMFRWFFNKGEMPKFDRWTYWEKFDFFAVFWGMIVIGTSGIILWAPEKASYILPGWVFNVAHILHSEEGLLAALFIFTVHYFNTHLIPNKFPMDRIIFTGRYKLEELRDQRPLEYERLVAENRLKSLITEHPNILTKLLSSAFGLFSLLLGIFCAGIIVLSLIYHYH